MAEFPVVVGAMQQKNFRVIAILSRYRGNRIVTTTTSGITSIKGLANKKVGVTLGTNANYQSDTVLQDAGIPVTDVNSVPADLVPALARGDIDAAVLFPSFFPLAKKILGDKYREFRTPAYSTTFVIVATTDVIAKHPDRVKAFLAGLIAANASVVANRDAAAASASRLMGGIAPADAILGLWSDYHFEVSLDPELLTLLIKEGAWIHKQGLVKGPEPSEQLLRSYIATGPLRELSAHTVTLR
jgi:ABC-type nitrate/sulfonate/bicarbonate transport system substrate-binding protein